MGFAEYFLTALSGISLPFDGLGQGHTALAGMPLFQERLTEVKRRHRQRRLVSAATSSCARPLHYPRITRVIAFDMMYCSTG